ncbi:hypothetical protein Taro_028430 [Colocasia esculenta]|uniref:t-SNARE coiled-coil homology domain-containing protein n=1 Tax=Colocasia esculenta TaxID=4460 RepID=A0A843VGG1_COLES|nr:hypothetical protein [Colocasia esculenta]
MQHVDSSSVSSSPSVGFVLTPSSLLLLRHDPLQRPLPRSLLVPLLSHLRPSPPSTRSSHLLLCPFPPRLESLDSWMREYNEASKLSDDISSMISGRGKTSGTENKSHTSAIRRKITILGTRLDSLESLLSRPPSKQPITDKELHKRQDLLAGLRSKAKQMDSAFNVSNFANREDLLGPGGKPPNELDRTAGLDNHGLVGLQRQILKEQDESLLKLEGTVASTKHIALAVNEELDLHTRLIDTLDQHVDSTDSRLQRVQKKLAILNKRTRGGCTCTSLIWAVMTIVFLAAVAFMLVKHL